LSEMLGFNIWLSVTDFFGKNVTCMQVLMWPLSVYYFCRPKQKM
jgi:hypothetical protein